MKKQEFLKDPEVKKFIAFLADKWKSGFEFKIGIKEKKNRQAYYKTVYSIREAYENYLWEYSIVKTNLVLPKEILLKASTLKRSERILDHSKDKLIIDGKLNTNEQELRDASEIILRWGGVYKSGNKEKIEDRNYNLIKTYSDVMHEWYSINNDVHKEFSPDAIIDFPSNAGFTKIYSLLLNDFIIYDSRVSVALAYLLEICFDNKIPNSLKLFIPPPAVVIVEKRAVHPFFKPTNHSKPSQHFYSNVKSSLLLLETIKIINQDDLPVTLRQMEAALFMIGYDIRN